MSTPGEDVVWCVRVSLFRYDYNVSNVTFDFVYTWIEYNRVFGENFDNLHLW